MTIKVLVNGASGRMGQQVVQALQTVDDLQLVGECDKDDDLAACITQTQAQVVVDFTTASAAFDNVRAIISAGAHPVIGTSGLMAAQVQQLQQFSDEKNIGGIIAPNFSLAAVLMMQSAQRIVKYFPQVEIIEAHRAEKPDAPSGTALRTAEMIAQSRVDMPPADNTEHEAIPGSRGASLADIPIHAVRLPGIIAQQQVLFGGQGETLTITHNTLDRESFMAGVLLACRKVINLQQLLVGLEHLLN